MLGHKISLDKFKTKIILSIFSSHNGIKLETNNRNKIGKLDIKREIKKNLEEFPCGSVSQKSGISLLWFWLQLWCKFNPWPRNFCMPLVWPKKKKQKNNPTLALKFTKRKHWLSCQWPTKTLYVQVPHFYLSLKSLFHIEHNLFKMFQTHWILKYYSYIPASGTYTMFSFCLESSSLKYLPGQLLTFFRF